jgi:hypothetical protein
MAKQREAAPLAEFVKITKVGQQVIGRVAKYFQNSNGPAVTLSPVILRSSNSGAGDRYAELALGLSTDLAQKVSLADVGKVIACAFTATRPSTKGSDTKLFQVFELDAADLVALKLGRWSFRSRRRRRQNRPRLRPATGKIRTICRSKRGRQFPRAWMAKAVPPVFLPGTPFPHRTVNVPAPILPND